MFIKGWYEYNISINGQGYAQYLATKHNKKVNLYDTDYNINVKNGFDWCDESNLPEEYIHAIGELWSLLDDEDAHNLYDKYEAYNQQKELSSNKRNVFILCELFITKEIYKVLKHNDDEYFQGNAYYVAVDDDYPNILDAMLNASNIINNIGRGFFCARPTEVETPKVISPRKNDVKDSTDIFGNTYEIGDLVAYGTDVSMICGITNCKLIIACGGAGVDKGSCRIIRKANGQPLKYGVFG